MNSTEDTKTYTREQHELIAEFSTIYGLQPEQIRFYSNDPQPFFDRDATAVLIHKLTDAVGIEDDLVPPPVTGSIAVKYRVTFEDGSFVSSTGVANLAETKNGNEPMSSEEIQSLATSRASRGALRNRGIDLVKLHYVAKKGNVADFSGPPIKNQRTTLLAQIHKLGQETGYILDGDKTLWHRLIAKRYSKAAATYLESSALSDEQLSDFAAFLLTMLPDRKAAA